jgi:hypothetical protein
VAITKAIYLDVMKVKGYLDWSSCTVFNADVGYYQWVQRRHLEVEVTCGKSMKL